MQPPRLTHSTRCQHSQTATRRTTRFMGTLLLPLIATLAQASSESATQQMSPTPSATDDEGIVVVRAPAERFAPGDRIIGWFGPAPVLPVSERKIADPIDWLAFAAEWLPRGDHGVYAIRVGDSRTTVVDLADEVGSRTTWRIRPVRDDAGARLATWTRLEALRASVDSAAEDAAADKSPPTIESFLASIAGFSPANQLLLNIEVADIVDRTGDLRQAATLLESALSDHATAIGDVRDDSDVDRPLTRALGHSRLGRLLRRLGEPQRATPVLERARDVQMRLAPGSLAVARTWNELGAVSLTSGDLEAAEDGFRRAFEIRREKRPEGAETALSLNNLGLVAEIGGRLDEAETFYRNALALQEMDDPEGVDLATTLNNIGIVASKRGDLEAAEHLFTRSLTIKERHRVPPAELGDQVNNVGIVHQQRGDLATAESFYRRALALRAGLNPAGIKTASSYGNLGWLMALRGDLETGEVLLLRSLALKEQHTPGGLPVAHALDRLGLIALVRQDPAAAERYLRRAEAIFTSTAPETLPRARTLLHLGRVVGFRGDSATARQLATKAVALMKQVAPNGLDLAIAHWTLGEIELKVGDLAKAREHGRQALDVSQKMGPRTTIAASSHRLLGDIATQRDQLADAERHYRAGIEIAHSTSLEGVEADAYLGLARVLRRIGQAHDATNAYAQAIELRAGYRQTLGGGDLDRARYGDAIHAAGQEFVDLLVEQGQTERAFDVAEGERAHSLRALLATRDLVHRQLPEALDRERRRLDTAYDRLLETIGRQGGTDEEDPTLRTRLADLQASRAELRTRIRTAAPRLAALREPRSLDLSSIQKSLEPGTLLLTFSIGDARSHLFAVRGGPSATLREPFRAISLDFDRSTLESRVSAFRRALARSRPGSASPIGPAEVDALGRWLYGQLLEPVADLIDRSERLIIVSDGVLDRLPFGALVVGDTTDDHGSKPRYLVEWKPLASTVSATVLAELRNARSTTTAKTPTPRFDLVGIGAPMLGPQRTATPDEQIEDPDAVSTALRAAGTFRNLADLEPLPGSRNELRSIADHYPADRVRLLLGSDASEARLRQSLATTRIAHFATHGLVDARAPLDSALVLSQPGRVALDGGNGLLQAWEIFEGLDLGAQLVVLSACDSGLGERLDGEGLYGLVRAFHYAGAPSVVASLWPVADASTAALMARFHAEVAAGRPLDQALRTAQMALIRGEADALSAHPYAWAGFQLYGDSAALDGTGSGAGSAAGDETTENP